MDKHNKAPNISIEKQVKFVEKFKHVREDYVEYADLLNKILNQAVSNISILAIVQTRPKCIISFAKKIIRKDKYTDPLKEVTDLCGARVIVHFQRQVEKICDFIKNNFEIDEENSLDLKSQLKINEFGYRSVHYIITPKKPYIAGVKIPGKFYTFKAEVQIRTLAEHVWADISHDRIYKTELMLPVEWRREAARLSAILEEADEKFGNMADKIDDVTRVYELQFSRQKAYQEAQILESLIQVLTDEGDDYQNENILNCLRLAAIFRAMNNFNRAIEILEPLQNMLHDNVFLMGKLAFEYGIMLALASGNKKDNEYYHTDHNIISNGIEILDDLDSDTYKDKEQEISYIYYRYGRLLQRDAEEKKAADYFNQAYCIMPENPLYLMAMMESLVLGNPDNARYHINLFKKHIYEAVHKLHELIKIGIKRVTAYFAIGHCYLFLNDETMSMHAYAKAVETILNDDYLTCHATVAMEMALISRFSFVNPVLIEKIELLLNIAIYIKNDSVYNHVMAKDFLEKHRVRKEHLKTPVVIVAGSASRMDYDKTDEYSDYIRELMIDFKGTIITGGTTAGIPGLVGRISNELKSKRPVQFDMVTYHPMNIADPDKSSGYDSVCETVSNEFSSLEILNCWADLVLDGINPADVILLGIEGGNIAALEYRIALALGAKVGLLEFSGGAATEILQDKEWKNHDNLLALPHDPLTVWALINQTTVVSMTKDEIEKLAPFVHDFYRKKNMESFDPESKQEDINKLKVILEWQYLESGLKDSNRKQVAFYELILNRVGLKMRKSENPQLFNLNSKENMHLFEMLAMLEHARWNAERLMEGWKYATKKDISAKYNPNINNWENLPPDVKDYDYLIVRNIPKMLQIIGYEVYKE